MDNILFFSIKIYDDSSIKMSLKIEMFNTKECTRYHPLSFSIGQKKYITKVIIKNRAPFPIAVCPSTRSNQSLQHTVCFGNSIENGLISELIALLFQIKPIQPKQYTHRERERVCVCTTQKSVCI